MFFSLALTAAAAVAGVSAQRPSNMSICDYYTTAVFKNNTPANQKTLLTLVVNTAVIGNYSNASTKAVAGILAPGRVNNTNVNLLPYFNGSLVSSNRNGQPIAINFLDDGGAIPLTLNKPANGTQSNQYRLLTHLYSYFGTALGCNGVGNDSFPAYSGAPSQFAIHRYMDLSYAEVTYFVQQVGGAASSLGVADADVAIVGGLLNSVFNVRCAPNTTVIPAQGPQLQSICTQNDCPLAANSTCSSYASVSEPGSATGTLAASSTSYSSEAMSTTSAPAGTSSTPAGTGAASTLGYSSALAVAAAMLAIAI